MISLIKLADEGKIIKTGAKPKLPIKVEGVSSDTLDVYQIPLKYLYYNDKNGRISTGIAEFEDEVNTVSDMVNPEYNNLVARIEVKGDNKIDDEVVIAKKEAAEKVAVASGVQYLMYAGSKIMSSNVIDLPADFGQSELI